MAALPVVVGGFWGGVRASMGGVPILHTMAWRQTSALPAGQAQGATIAEGIASAWPAHMVALMSNQYTVTESFTYELENPTTPAFTHAMTGTGANTSTPAPDQVCALIHHAVAVRGHGRQGRTFLPVRAQTDVGSDGKTLDSSWRTAVQSAWEAFVTDVQSHVFTVDGATVAFGVLSRVHATVTPRVSSSVESIIATQRRRLLRG